MDGVRGNPAYPGDRAAGTRAYGKVCALLMCSKKKCTKKGHNLYLITQNLRHMSAIKELRELTGLSHARIAAWLGVSKTMVRFAESGERDLGTDASLKVTNILLFLQDMKAKQNKPALKAGFSYSNPAKLAERHRRKAAFHQRSAAGLQVQLQKLRSLHPKLNNRLKLLNQMKKAAHSDERDKAWIEMTEWFSNERLSSAGPEEQDLLQDKIDMHLAYARLHRMQQERYEGMEQKRIG